MMRQTVQIDQNKLFCDLDEIRKTNPLIHNITNQVAMPISANLLLALGASPIMANAPQELEDILYLSKSLVINSGTLDDGWIHSAIQAQQIALTAKIPIVLDPVGAGASCYRTETAKKILAEGVHVVRGNASEIMALQNVDIKTKGVDSLQRSENALAAASQLAEKYHCVVVVSGKIDFIIDANRTAKLDYGTPLFTKVVGMGCSVTAIIASFLAVNPDPFYAAMNAMALFGMTGQLAAQKISGPGSFFVHLLDCLYNLKQSDLLQISPLAESKIQ